MTDVSDVPELDPVIHAAARLKVTATLAALPPGDRISFPRLQQLLGMTAGNLSTHLRRLEDAAYVDVVKTHAGRNPATYLSLSPTGRRALDSYTDTLRRLLSLDGAPTGVPTGGPAGRVGTTDS